MFTSHHNPNPASRTPFAQISLHELNRLNSLPASSLRVYISLSSHANQAGTCWPGRNRIASQTNLNREQVSKATSILAMAGLIEKRYLENGRVIYRLPYHESATPSPEPESRDGLSVRFTPAPGSPWRQLPEPEVTPPDVRIDTSPCRDRHPEPIRELTEGTERAAPEPTVLPALSVRILKTLPPDTVPEDWVAIGADLRPDLEAGIIESSAIRFLDDRRSKGIRLVDWLPSWRNWIRNERGPKKKPPKVTYSPIVYPNPYGGWEPGQKAPIGVVLPPESAIAAFEKDMAALGAVKQPDGVWTRPAPLAPMIPLTPEAVTAATVAIPAVEPDTPAAPVDMPAVTTGREYPVMDARTEQPRRTSPLHGLLAGLRSPSIPRPAAVPWRRPDTPIIDPDELAQAEALLAAEIAKRRQGG